MRKRTELTPQDVISVASQSVKKFSGAHAEFSCSYEKGFSLDVRHQALETLTHHGENAFSVTIFLEGRTGHASCNDFSAEAIAQTVDKAFSIAKFTSVDPFSGLPDKTQLAFQYPDCDLYHPWNISIEDAEQLAIQCEAAALENKRISQSEGTQFSTMSHHYILGNTFDFRGEYAVSEHVLSCTTLAGEASAKQRDYEYTAARNKDDLLSARDIGVMAAEKTLARLNPRKIKTQKCPVIFKAPVAKSLINAFVQAASGRNLYRQSSFLLNALGQRIFPNFIHIEQQPHLPSAMGSVPFDHEGVQTKPQAYVRDGELMSYFLGSYSARKLGLTTTGNAGGAFNLCISHSDQSFDDLIKKMGKGLVVTEMMGQGINLTTGDYSRGAAGFEYPCLGLGNRPAPDESSR